MLRAPMENNRQHARIGWKYKQREGLTERIKGNNKNQNHCNTNGMSFIGSSVDWTWPRKKSVNFKICH